jgi:hypothetical protein
MDCKSILITMDQIGYDVCPPEWVDTWSDSEVDYFHANYAPHYINPIPEKIKRIMYQG